MLVSLGSLLLIAILVQSVYATFIRPHAQALIAESAAAAASSQAPGRQLQLRSIFVILKDYEQETAIVLTFCRWG